MEKRLVGGAALPNGAVACRLVEERRFVRRIKVDAGADVFGGRRAKLLKGPASGRGVAPRCNTVLSPERRVAEEIEASGGVLQLLVVEEKRIARTTSMRGGGG